MLKRLYNIRRSMQRVLLLDLRKRSSDTRSRTLYYRGRKHVGYALF